MEPNGIICDDGKRLDGATLIPWKCGKPLVWDTTCPDTLAPSCMNLAIREAGAVAGEAERRKRLKYSNLISCYHFVPIATETLGVFGLEAWSFLKELGYHFRDTTVDPLSHHFLLQRISAAIQQGNATAILGSP